MTTSAAHNLPRPASLWWLLVLLGVVALGVGVFFVADPNETLSTFAVIVGIFLLIDAALTILASIFGHVEGRGLVALLGVLSAIAGLILIKHPFEVLTVFALIVGVWFVVAGIARLVSAFGSTEGRVGNMAIALLDVIAGVVILAWPHLGVATFAVIIGIALIARGLLFIIAGWQLRKIDQQAVNA